MARLSQPAPGQPGDPLCPPPRAAVTPAVLSCHPETRLRNGDDVRAALFEAQEMVMPEIQEQIQDYRWPSGAEPVVHPPRASARCPGSWH